jgi:hypothetical protein
MIDFTKSQSNTVQLIQLQWWLYRQKKTLRKRISNYIIDYKYC